MDIRTGQIHDAAAVAQMTDEQRRYMRPMKHAPTTVQLRDGYVGRNDYCPCGSGLKFKRCCLLRQAMAAV
jgi:uncharacterized protein YecA (UPF0149 family)